MNGTGPSRNARLGCLLSSTQLRGHSFYIRLSSRPRLGTLPCFHGFASIRRHFSSTLTSNTRAFGKSQAACPILSSSQVCCLLGCFIMHMHNGEVFSPTQPCIPGGTKRRPPLARWPSVTLSTISDPYFVDGDTYR